MPDIGATLREARMRAKIDINEVEARTKIRAKYLRAIENEEWDLLPGDVYVKSFLRTYGDYLGLDTRQLLDDFRRRYERPSDNEMRPIAPLGRERDRHPRGPLIPPWLVVGVVLVGVVVVLYIVGKGNGGKPKPASTGSTHPTVTAHKHHRSRHRRSGVVTGKPKSVKLQLVATGPIYICLVDGKGKKLIPGQTFNTGETIPAETSSKLLLTLGNAQVKMKVNGASVTIAPSSKPIGYELLPGSERVLPPSQQPTCA
jgi:cytoskeletal protein RodZ